MSDMSEKNNNDNASSGAVLSVLFQRILFRRNINIDTFNAYLDRYINRANIPKDLKKISSFRGNLRKELLKDTMSWKTFIKGLCFLNVEKFEISIKIHWNGSEKNAEVITIPITIDANSYFE